MKPPVHGIEVLARPMDDAVLMGSALDLPRTGDASAIYALRLEGWVLGRQAPVDAIEVVEGGSVLQRLAVDRPSPAAAAAFGEGAGAERCGFGGLVSVLGLPSPFEVQLVPAAAGGGRGMPIAVIRAERRPLRTKFKPKLRPLMVTTMGRSGSNWVLDLLDYHPQLVAYEPFRSETRVASYWLDIARALTRPPSYLQTLAPAVPEEYWWLGRTDRIRHTRFLDEEVEEWVGGASVEEIVAFGQRMVDEFYTRVARVWRKRKAVYFVEKFAPRETVDLMWEVYPNAREIVLVRDFRDQICSMLAYGRKRGMALFGREEVESDEAFVRLMQRRTTKLLADWRRRAGRAHLVRYEDLVRDDGQAVIGLLAYLGVDRSPALLEGMLGYKAQATVHQPGHGTSADALASIGRWRRDLSPALQEVCADALRVPLEGFGYEV